MSFLTGAYAGACRSVPPAFVESRGQERADTPILPSMPGGSSWADRVLVALARLGQAEGESELLVEVAVSQADRFESGDRAYTGDRPNWHHHVQATLERLRREGLAEELQLTASGREQHAAAVERLAQAPRPMPPPEAVLSPTGQPILVTGVLSPPLRTAAGRAAPERTAGQEQDDVPIAVMVELNLAYEDGPTSAWPSCGAGRPAGRWARRGG